MKKITFYLFFAILSISLQINAQVFTEDFEAGVPDLMAQTYVSGTVDWTDCGGNSGPATCPYTGGSSAHFYIGSYDGDQTALDTPSIDLSSGAAYQLRFSHVQPEWYGDQNTLDVEISLDDGGTWSNVVSYVNDIPNWVDETIALDTFTLTSTTKFRFIGTDLFGYAVGLDDIIVEEVPSCPMPSAMADANLTDTSVDLTWTAGASETMWEVVYDTDPYAMPANGMADATGEPGYTHVDTTPELSLSGLTANTTYQVYYRAHCGGTDYSDWRGYTFTTLATPPANDDACNAVVLTVDAAPVTGTNVEATAETSEPVGSCFYGSPLNSVWYSFVATSEDVIISTDFVTPLNDTQIALYAATDCADMTTFTEIACDQDSGSTGNGWNSIIETTGAPLTLGETYYIQVDGYNSKTDEFQIEVKAPPACPAPTGMATSNLTDTSTDLTWTAGNTETDWEVVYDVDPYTMPANGMADATGEPGYNHVSTTPTLSLTGLTQNTTYQVYYRADCGGGLFSDWVGYTFTTPPPPPANDDCTGAVVITPESGVADANSATQTAGDIAGATDSGIPAAVCDGFTGTANDDVWFSFTADATDYNVTLFDTFDGVVEVFSGDCTNLTHIDCKDNGTDPEINLTGLTNGDTYYIRVYAYSSIAQTNTTFGLAVWRTYVASISDLQAVGFTYYPNPVSNNLTMKANENIDHISVFNMLGQKVKSVNPSALETSIDMSDLSTGTYFVKAQVGSAIGTFKIVKE